MFRASPGTPPTPMSLDLAGARDADMIVAATHSDEVNMVTCQVAHSVVFGAPARIGGGPASGRKAISPAIYSRPPTA